MKDTTINLRTDTPRKIRLIEISIINNRSYTQQVEHWIDSYPQELIDQAFELNPDLVERVADITDALA